MRQVPGGLGTKGDHLIQDREGQERLPGRSVISVATGGRVAIQVC